MSYLNAAIEEIERALLDNKSDEVKEVYLRNAIRFIEEAQRKLESYNDELIRDNNQLRNALDNQEVLSQEWIDEHAQGDYDEWVYTEDLQNLIVPKQDKQEVEENFYAFDNAKKWLQDNGFVVFEKDKLDEEAQRMIDEAYDATNEKPLIPQFVADYIELNKGWSEDRQEYIEDDSNGLWFALDGNSYGMPNSVSDWLFNEEKVETFAKAWLDGYEVEKEKRYYIINKENNATLMTFELSDVVGKEIIEFVYGYSENETIHFNSKEKAELIAHFVGETLEVEEVTE